MKPVLLGVLVVVWGSMALAQVGDSLERIEAERLQVQAESQSAEARCYERFVVNACLSEVSAAKRMRLAQLKKRELAVRDAQRAERTREQLERLEEKQQAQETRLRELEERVPEPAPVPKQAPQAATGAGPLKEKTTPLLSPAEASSNRSAYEAKVLEAARHKADVEKRLQEQKDRAEPLPVAP